MFPGVDNPGVSVWVIFFWGGWHVFMAVYSECDCICVLQAAPLGGAY